MFSRRISARYNRGRAGRFGGAAFNGNFANFWAFQVGAANVLQSVQTDLGLTYGGTMLATGTTPPVITLTGTITGPYTGFTITDTLIGALGVWTGLVTYLIDGSTQAFTSAATVPLTGAGAGLTLNIAAGVAAGDNVWQATASALADQSGLANNYVQATASKQSIITIGVNGKPGLLADGVDDDYTCAGLTLPAPGTTPTYGWLLMRQITWASQEYFLTATASPAHYFRQRNAGASPQLEAGNATANTPQNSAAALNAWVRAEMGWTNSVNDFLRVAGTETGTVNGGNATAAGRRLFSNNVLFVNGEVIAGGYLSVIPTQAQRDAFSAAVTTYSGGLIAV